MGWIGCMIGVRRFVNCCSNLGEEIGYWIKGLLLGIGRRKMWELVRLVIGRGVGIRGKNETCCGIRVLLLRIVI